MKALHDRFLAKIKEDEKTGCWIWTASLGTTGYGQFNVCGKMIKAHRFSFELFNGKIPKWMCVCHKCDNRMCVNPDHLFLGTRRDNIYDAISKGRFISGEKVGTSKLSISDVMQIRSMVDTSQRKIAKCFGISQQHVSAILSRKWWKNI